MIGWIVFSLYYATGFFVCMFAVDQNGNTMPWWHAIWVALVWPVLFLMPFD